MTVTSLGEDVAVANFGIRGVSIKRLLKTSD